MCAYRRGTLMVKVRAGLQPFPGDSWGAFLGERMGCKSQPISEAASLHWPCQMGSPLVAPVLHRNRRACFWLLLLAEPCSQPTKLTYPSLWISVPSVSSRPIVVPFSSYPFSASKPHTAASEISCSWALSRNLPGNRTLPFPPSSSSAGPFSLSLLFPFLPPESRLPSFHTESRRPRDNRPPLLVLRFDSNPTPCLLVHSVPTSAGLVAMSLFAWCTRRSGGLAMIALAVLCYWVISKESAASRHGYKYQQQDSISSSSYHPVAKGAGYWTVIFAYYCLGIHILVFLFPLRACWAIWDLTRSLQKTARSKTLRDFKLTHRRRGSSTSLSSSETLTSSHGCSASSSEAGDLEMELYADADATPDRVVHAIIIPNYKEEMDTLKETLEVLASHPQARNSYDVSFPSTIPTNSHSAPSPRFFASKLRARMRRVCRL